MAATLKGVTCLYGVAGTMTNIFVQSYTLTKSYELNDLVQDETGKTVTARYDGITRELSVDGICKSNDMPDIGASITFIVSTDVGVAQSFTGVIESVEEKGGNKEFVKVSVKAKQWESIASYA